MRKFPAFLAVLAFAALFSACRVKPLEPLDESGAPATYAITYRSGSAESGAVPGPQVKESGEPVVLALNSGNLAMAGLVAVGWNTQADGKGADYAFGSSYSADAALDLYPKFLAPPSLVSIDPSAGVFDKPFDPMTTEYCVVLADDATSFSLSAVAPLDPLYTISYSVPQPMALALGSNRLTATVSLPGAADRVYAFDLRREGRFVTEWLVPGAGASVTLPLETTNFSVFDCTVDWGDGTAPTAITMTNYTATRMHSYAVSGTYWISISGTCEGWDFQVVPASRQYMQKVLSWGDPGTFSGFKHLNFYSCQSLSFLPTGGIKGPSLASLRWCFSYCDSLLTLPADLFRRVPSVTSFAFAFFDCDFLSAVPDGLFRNNTEAENFSSTFERCHALATVPMDLFQHNAKATDFSYAFCNCWNLQMNPSIFYPAGGESTRFAGKTMNFTSCFTRTSSSSAQGTAPNLWACSYGSVTSTGCFSGNSSASLSNYADIPTAWK